MKETLALVSVGVKRIGMIGPFDGHAGQSELQSRLEGVLKQWNAEAAERALAKAEKGG